MQRFILFLTFISCTFLTIGQIDNLILKDDFFDSIEKNEPFLWHDDFEVPLNNKIVLKKNHNFIKCINIKDSYNYNDDNDKLINYLTDSNYVKNDINGWYLTHDQYNEIMNLSPRFDLSFINKLNCTEELNIYGNFKFLPVEIQNLSMLTHLYVRGDNFFSTESHINKSLNLKKLSLLKDVRLSDVYPSSLKTLLDSCNIKELSISSQLIIKPVKSDPNLYYNSDCKNCKGNKDHYLVMKSNVNDIIDNLPNSLKTKSLTLSGFSGVEQLHKINLQTLEELTIQNSPLFYLNLNNALDSLVNLKKLNLKGFVNVNTNKKSIPIVCIDTYYLSNRDKIFEKIKSDYFNKLIENFSVKILILEPAIFLGKHNQLTHKPFKLNFLKDKNFEQFYFRGNKDDFYKIFKDTSTSFYFQKVVFVESHFDFYRKLPNTINELIDCMDSEDKMNNGFVNRVIDNKNAYYSNWNPNTIEKYRPYLKIRYPNWIEQYDKKEYFLPGNIDEKKEINDLSVLFIDTLFSMDEKRVKKIEKIYNPLVLNQINEFSNLLNLSIYFKNVNFNLPTLDKLENLKQLTLDGQICCHKTLKDSIELIKMNLNLDSFDIDNPIYFKHIDDKNIQSFLKNFTSNPNLSYLKIRDIPINDYNFTKYFKNLQVLNIHNTILDRDVDFSLNKNINNLVINTEYLNQSIINQLTKTGEFTLYTKLKDNSENSIKYSNIFKQLCALYLLRNTKSIDLNNFKNIFILDIEKTFNVGDNFAGTKDNLIEIFNDFDENSKTFKIDIFNSVFYDFKNKYWVWREQNWESKTEKRYKLNFDCNWLLIK